MDEESQGVGENPDMFEEYRTLGREHPTAEQAMIKMAIEKALMNKQRKVWEMYNNERLTFVEIAAKLKVSEGAIRQQIQTIEKQLAKWCEDHMEAYNAVIEAQKYKE